MTINLINYLSFLLHTYSFFFLVVFFVSVLFIHKILDYFFPIEKIIPVSWAYYKFTFLFPIFVFSLFVPYLLNKHLVKIEITENSIVMFLIWGLVEAIVTFYILYFYSQKYKEKIERFTSIFIYGRISFSIVLTIFAKIFLDENLAQEKIKAITSILEGAVLNFDELFYCSCEKEGFFIAELYQRNVSGILELGIKLNSFESIDCYVGIFFFSFFAPIYTFLGIIIGVVDLKPMWHLFKEEYTNTLNDFLVNYMFSKTKNIPSETHQKTVLLKKESKPFSNHTKYFRVKKDKSVVLLNHVEETLGKKRINIINNREDLIVHNIKHCASILTKNPREYIKTVEEVATQVGTKFKMIKSNSYSGLKHNFKGLDPYFYAYNQRMYVKNYSMFLLGESLEEQEVSLKIKQLFEENYKDAYLRMTLAMREDTSEFLGVSLEETKKQRFLYINYTTVNTLFFLQQHVNNVLENYINSNVDADQEDPFNLSTKKILVPQFAIAQEFSEQNGWELKPYLEKGQGDYVIVDQKTKEEKILEIKAPTKKMNCVQFEKKCNSLIKDSIEKINISTDNKRLVMGLAIMETDEKHTCSELTEKVQKIIAKKYKNFQDKIEVKIKLIK